MRALRALSIAILVIACCQSSVCNDSIKTARQPTELQLRDAPITIAASREGQFAEGFSWYLSVNSDGQGVLTVDTYPKQVTRRLEISDEQISMLRSALASEAFFSLNERIGSTVFDGNRSTITIVVGGSAKSVRIEYLANLMQDGPSSALNEAARGVKVRQIIRNWFEEPAAFDGRSYDERFLKEAQAAVPSKNSTDSRD